MKLVHKLIVATLMLPGIAHVQLAMAGDPIPGVDYPVRPAGGKGVAVPSKAKSGETVAPNGTMLGTSTSSIKRPSKAESREADAALMQVSTTRGTAKEGAKPDEPAGAPVNTTRSNKKN